MNRQGQVLIEFPIVLGLVVLPLLLGCATWFVLEFDRSKCAYLGFFQARRELILTGQAVHLSKTCGAVQEKIELSDLESLDQDKGGLTLGDSLKAASQLWEGASSFYRQSRASGSIRSSPALKPSPETKSNSINAPDDT